MNIIYLLIYFMGCSGSCLTHEEKIESNRIFPRSRQMSLTGNVIHTEEDIKLYHNNVVLGNKGKIGPNYRIDSQIGTGSYGKVYKVTYLPLKQKRAMKVVKILSLGKEEGCDKFIKEIEMLMQLDHPNIIKIYEYYIDEVNYYIITELATGGELYDQIAKLNSFTEEQAVIIMRQLVSAVCYMHSKGIVHRDIKPENILLEDMKGDFNLKLIDFGTSNYYSKDQKLTLKVGTPYYIAPEVIKNNYNNKCDIWSLGVIMYVLLSGCPPFDGEDDDAIINLVKKGKYTMTGEEWSTVSPEAQDLISRMLTYDPNKRISSDDALKHPWFTKFHSLSLANDAITIFKKPFENLRKFHAKQKLQQATIAFLVHHASNSDMINDLKQIFKELDLDGNGMLSYDEIKEGFKKYYGEEKIGEKEFENIMKVIDQDKNQNIEYEEFLSATINLEQLLTDDNLKLAFNTFDKDGSQQLSADEIKSALGLIGSEMETMIIKNIIQEIDINGDGLVSFDEFKSLMLKALTH